MTTTLEKRHRCGGALVAGEVRLLLEPTAGISILYLVDGWTCDRCREELIDRRTALQGSQTPTVAWHSEPEGIISTWLDEIKFETITAGTRLPEALVY